MPSAATIRLQIEAALARKIPSALTPAQKVIRPVAPTGVAEVDALLEGGLPVGAITEMEGTESSGRTSLALSFLAGITRAGNVGAWIDVLNTFDPESAAAAGVDLSRLLWVRCGVSTAKARPTAEYRFALPEKYFVAAGAMKGLHGGGCGGHRKQRRRSRSSLIQPTLTISPAPLKYLMRVHTLRLSHTRNTHPRLKRQLHDPTLLRDRSPHPHLLRTHAPIVTARDPG